MIVGGQRAQDRLCGVVVVPDRDGQCENALHDAGDYAAWCAATVLSEVELPFEALVDRLDDLPQWLEQGCPGALWFASEQVQQGLAFVGLGPVRAKAIGSTWRVHTRCSRRHQKNRLWLAQYPYSAQPARLERLTVSRERPHSTGVVAPTGPDSRGRRFSRTARSPECPDRCPTPFPCLVIHCAGPGSRCDSGFP